MILSIVRKAKSKGKILTSDKMEVDENLLSLWLLNRIPIPHFKNRISMMKYITALSLLTENQLLVIYLVQLIFFMAKTGASLINLKCQ